MQVQTIKRYSKKTNPELRAIAKKWFNKFIRLRDTDVNGYGRCISSPHISLRYGSPNAHAGHFYSGGKFRHLEFDEDNVHLQSRSDNYYNHGNESMYRIHLISKIGQERFDELEQKALISKRMPFKDDRYALIEIIEKYKAKVKEISKTKMFKV